MSDREPREMHIAVCSDCGNECQVPFKPDPSSSLLSRLLVKKKTSK